MDPKSWLIQIEPKGSFFFLWLYTDQAGPGGQQDQEASRTRRPAGSAVAGPEPAEPEAEPAGSAVAGPAGCRLQAPGFRLQASGFWLLAKRNPPRQPGADIFAPKSYTKVTQKLHKKLDESYIRKLHTKVTYESYIGFWTKVTYESYIRKLEMKVTYNSSYFTPICP